MTLARIIQHATQPQSMGLFNLQSGLFTAFTLALVGCSAQVNDSASPSGFILVSSNTRETLNHPISQLDDIDYEVELVGKARHEILLRNLDLAQFERVKKTFWANSPLTYASRDFSLSEFLPPAMQALEGHKFDYGDGVVTHYIHKIGMILGISGFKLFEDGKGTDIHSFRVLSNCWNTAYELLRGRTDSFLHFFASDVDALRYLDDGAARIDDRRYSQKNTEYSQFIKEFDCQPSGDKVPAICLDDDRAQRNQGLQFGDLLLISNAPDRLEHAAIYLADDLFFELSGIDKNSIYRISSWSQIRKIKAYRDSHYVFRRFNGEGFKPLPNPHDVFGTHRENAFVKPEYQQRWKVVEFKDLGTSVYAYTEIPLISNSGAQGRHYALHPAVDDDKFFVTGVP